MKKFLWMMAMMMVMCGAQANPLIKQTSPAVYADVELPFRCHAPNAEKQISTTIALDQDDFVFLPLDAGDMLPRYSVNGYIFKNEPVDKVLANLLENAGIKVLAPSGEYVYLTSDKITGELSTVVQQLADAGDVFYSYKESTKTFTILRRAEFGLNVPKNKTVLMAVLDALRGSQISNIDVDWEHYQIQMNVSPDELQKAKSLIRKILNDSYLLATEIQGYQVIPATNADWQGVINNMTGHLAASNKAVVGRSIVLSSRSMVEDFLSVARRFYQIDPVVAGEAVVPNGWQMRFDVNECSNYTLPYPNLSVLMQTKIKNKTNANTKVTLVTSAGTLTSFNIKNGLNQEVALIGIPMQQGNAEMLFLLRFNLIRFVQKGEKND